MTPERRNRLRALGKTRAAITPAMAVAGAHSGIALVTRVTRVTRDYDQPGSAASLPGTGNVSCGLGLNQVDHWAEVEERAAIAQHEGGFPALFALAFARLQLEPPQDMDATLWQKAVDAMGRLLDQSRDLAHTGDTGDTGDG